VIIEIISASLADEAGLGPLYRIEQRRDGQRWVHLIARSAVASDMELFGVDNPATVVEWHLHEALAPLTTDPSPADQLAFQAQQLTAAVLTARTRLTAATADQPAPTRLTADLATDLAAAQDEADTLREQARELKTAEINHLKETVTIADDPRFAALCALVTEDTPGLDAERATYRDHITNRVAT
jgi:hypothetical protein